MTRLAAAPEPSETAAPADLLLEPEQRARLWSSLEEILERYLEGLRRQPVSRKIDAGDVRDFLRRIDFESPSDPAEALRWAATGLDRFHVHNAHPAYFGLFIPAASTMGIAADALAAAYNPNPAAWNLSPFAVEAELRLIRQLAGRFGFDPASAEGCFTSGGSEANHTAVAVALCGAFPQIATRGLRSLPAEPVLYHSAEGHHSIQKAARLCGLGSNAVRLIPVDGLLRADPEALRRQIRRDRSAGRAPFLIVATAGSTNAGVLDPLEDLAEVAAEESLWLHVDAAWGGAFVLLPELQPAFSGIERADSITFDPHKGLSVPMAAGLYLGRRPGALETAFSIDEPYMPRGREGIARIDFYRRSMPWARRFTGLKVYLSLAVAGWQGYRKVLRHQVAMGHRLRRGLAAAGFSVVNTTPLPLVCFVDGAPAGPGDESVAELAAGVMASGRAWISTTRIGSARQPVLRASVTSFHTGEREVDRLIAACVDARTQTAPQRAEIGK